MGRTPTSSAGRQASSDGWSLVELVVVLVIIAAASSLALPSLHDSLPSLRLSTQAHEIAVMLRDAQRTAIESGKETAVQINLTDKSLKPDYGQLLKLDPQFAIELTSAAEFSGGAGWAQIRFFPDGTSTGAQLHLSYRQRHIDVVVDWMVGKAVLRDE